MPPAGEDDVIHDHHRHHQISSPTSNPSSRHPSFLSTLRSVFADSIEILISNPKIFSFILLLALPLSFLLSSLSLTSSSIRRRILHLQSLASIVSVRIEALNILDEAREDAKSLLHLRILNALVTLPLSILILSSSASTTSSLLRRRRRPSLSSLLASVKSIWWRSLLTGVLAHATAIVYGELARTLAVVSAAIIGPAAGFIVAFVTLVVEFYLKSVLYMGMVVSVVEERWYGVDAFRIGWEVMVGKRMAGMVVAGVVEAASGGIWWLTVGLAEIDIYGGDWNAGFRSREGMSLWWRAWSVSLYAFVLVWSNVLVTSLNCDCTAGFKLVADDTYF